MSPLEGALAGLIAGWVCFVSGHWLSIVGLPKLDLGAIGRRYLDADVAGWCFGVLHHLVNSALLGALYVVGVDWLREDSEVLDITAGLALGLGYGVVVWAVVAMSLVLPASGRGWFGSKLDSKLPVLGNLIVHLVFGALLGAIAR